MTKDVEMSIVQNLFDLSTQNTGNYLKLNTIITTCLE